MWKFLFGMPENDEDRSITVVKASEKEGDKYSDVKCDQTMSMIAKINSGKTSNGVDNIVVGTFNILVDDINVGFTQGGFQIMDHGPSTGTRGRYEISFDLIELELERIEWLKSRVNSTLTICGPGPGCGCRNHHFVGVKTKYPSILTFDRDEVCKLSMRFSADEMFVSDICDQILTNNGYKDLESSSFKK